MLLIVASPVVNGASSVCPRVQQVSDSSMIIHKADSLRQVDLIDYIVRVIKVKNSKEKRDNSKVRFSLFPAESNMSGGVTVFTSFNIAFLLGDISRTNVSTVYFIPYIAFGGQYGFQLQQNIWLRDNSWNFTGDYFSLNYPQYTWGLGGDRPSENKTLIKCKHLRIHQKALKGILPNLAVGIGYAYDYHYDLSVQKDACGEIINDCMPDNRDHTTSSGLTLPVIYDSRSNTINPEHGLFSSFTYSFYDPVFGSDDRWQSLFFDIRKYVPLTRGKYSILALRSYYWTVISGTPPYFDLPANRWEPVSGSASRGIAQNRYRSDALLYFEAEYRFGITTNGLLGGVVFANIISASQYDTQHFLYWHPAAGAGIRVKFNKYSGMNVMLDYGISKGYQAVYLNIGEAF